MVQKAESKRHVTTSCGPLNSSVSPIFVASLSETSGAEKEKKVPAGRCAVSAYRRVLPENAKLEEHSAYPGPAQSQHAAPAWSIRLPAGFLQIPSNTQFWGLINLKEEAAMAPPLSRTSPAFAPGA